MEASERDAVDTVESGPTGADGAHDAAADEKSVPETAPAGEPQSQADADEKEEAEAESQPAAPAVEEKTAPGDKEGLLATLREREHPLEYLYEQLVSLSGGSTERRIAQSLRHYQNYQLECLQLLDGQVPDKFEAFGLVTHNEVNVRKSTSGKSPLVVEVDRGTRVVIQEKTGFWFRVQLSDGREGYIFQDYIREDEL